MIDIRHPDDPDLRLLIFDNDEAYAVDYKRKYAKVLMYNYYDKPAQKLPAELKILQGICLETIMAPFGTVGDIDELIVYSTVCINAAKRKRKGR